MKKFFAGLFNKSGQPENDVRPEETPSDSVRRHLKVYGRVQGVGFRYRAYYTAMELGLTGWAANLDDGSVEMELQGKEELIELLMKRMGEMDHIYIDHYDMTEQPVRSEKGFRVLN